MPVWPLALPHRLQPPIRLSTLPRSQRLWFIPSMNGSNKRWQNKVSIHDTEAVTLLLGQPITIDTQSLDYRSNVASKYSFAKTGEPYFDLLESPMYIELQWYYASAMTMPASKHQHPACQNSVSPDPKLVWARWLRHCLPTWCKDSRLKIRATTEFW